MDKSWYSSSYDLHLPSSMISFLLRCSQINRRAAGVHQKISKSCGPSFKGSSVLSRRRMKHAKAEARNSWAAREEGAVRPPPPPPPLPNFRARRVVTETSVTNREIARFWRQKRIEEEDHLLAAIKAAARVRARKLSEDDYKRFLESLEDVNDGAKENTAAASNNKQNHAEEETEVRIGIKDWWTKSKYAYLNQPALESMDRPRRTSSYTPNCFSYKPLPLYPTSLGVF